MRMLNIVKNNLKNIIWTTIYLVAVVLFVSSFMVPKYQVDIKILTMHDQSGFNDESYSASKSSDYLVDILSRIILTESFLQHVMKSPFEINKKFSDNFEKREREWRNDLIIKKDASAGIISISVFSENKNDASNIASAIAWVISEHGFNYYGNGENIKISTIHGPVIHPFVVRPNLLANITLGFIFGLVGNIGYLYFFKK